LAQATSHRVALVVTGSIAAYKAPMVARALLAAGFDVVPVMTRSAQQFVGPATLSGLTGNAVATEIFDGEGGERHVDLAASVEAILVVPATADFLARMASGRADDLATATLLSSRVPVWVAPAMHPAMWSHPATVANVATLVERGVHFIGPVLGPVASGEVGLGRMAEPEAIAATVTSALLRAPSLAGRHVVVSAGPTVEDLDPVRFLSNRSTGKMGFAVAAEAARRGANVTLVAGPVALETPRGVTRVDVRSALSMQAALDAALGSDLTKADVLVMSAAVGDYRFSTTADHKLKRTGEALTLTLVPNPDLLAELGARRQGARPVLVGFAVETGDDEGIVREGRRKLDAKRVDLVVANPAAESFGRDDNRAFLVSRADAIAVGTVEKRVLAETILDRVEKLLEEP
jgi:phosphopantothenoylcysteine decarboxylase / phosphopantothenate---cysteine ligase